jgi:hypothetical protein
VLRNGQLVDGFGEPVELVSGSPAGDGRKTIPANILVASTGSGAPSGGRNATILLVARLASKPRRRSPSIRPFGSRTRTGKSQYDRP